MSKSSDLTFITNENGQNLLERFKVLIKDTEFFDVLVGYFYTSGFYKLYKALEKTKKIRILIGIGTNKETVELIEQAKQSELQFSHVETKDRFSDLLADEMSNSQDSKSVEEGVLKFLEWLQSGKLEIRAYPSQGIHSKLYIMTFNEKDRDVGRVITGSSNFTQAGLVDNLEFNVELKNRADYDFAKSKFEGLWSDAVDIKDKYIQTIQERTWLNNTITPYQLYLKFLYEYFKDELQQTGDVIFKYIPAEFKRLEYQKQAVLNAKKILEEYGGVFISDVVGLGKTYVSAMLASQLDGYTLVLAPPVLLEKANPGSWPNVFSDFRVAADFESIGKLDDIIKRGIEKYKNVIIDEAHRFRTETNTTYEKMAQICRGKRVILVTATPYNNSPKDILSQMKLFQNARKSTIPNLLNLEKFFNTLEERLKRINRKENYESYLKIVRENAKDIREKVLKFLMVRRTRAEIAKYFEQDLNEQRLKFPEVKNPTPLFYELDDDEDEIFNITIELITEKFKYSRYTPLLYYKGEITHPEEISQKNMGKFMKILLVKRLESSFFAFRNSIDRFINSYDMFIKEFDKGNVYVSKKYANKIFEFLENDDDEAIQKLIDEGKADRYSSSEFKDDFRADLQNDFEILKQIKNLWKRVNRDPKLLKFISELKKNDILKKNKLIVFTESKETAEHLSKQLEEGLGESILCFSGGSSEIMQDKVIKNFDAKAHHQNDDYRILVSTEVMSEGVNLHRSNVVINYDIPWNPTRMMQRVGRINRVDTKFNTIYTFNFFPTKQSNNEIKLKEIAESKINAFLTLLGGDSALLTEGEPIASHELFNRLISKNTITGEDETEESELKYLQVIKNIRDKEPDLFEKIKHLPKKARTAKSSEENYDSLLTYFRYGKIQKFFITSDSKDSKELDFITAAKILESKPDEKRQKTGEEYYEFLEKNKETFKFTTTEELIKLGFKGGRDSTIQVLKILKAAFRDTRQFTEDQIDYYKKVMRQLEEGGMPKKTIKEISKSLNNLNQDISNPFKVLATLQIYIPQALLQSHYAEQKVRTFGKREVILSLFLRGKENG